MKSEIYFFHEKNFLSGNFFLLKELIAFLDLILVLIWLILPVILSRQGGRLGKLNGVIINAHSYYLGKEDIPAIDMLDKFFFSG